MAQENSPYSRYGMGDIAPNQNMVSRAMGGITAGYADFQSINMINPAALGQIRNTIYDIAGEVDIRNLKSNTSPQKFRSVNTLISYLQLGVPLSSAKMLKKKQYWGASFGLRPLTRINYKIENNYRPQGLDSLNTIYEGSGGITQANISTGIRIKNLSIGINTGYNFGSRDYSTILNFISDSVAYFKSNTTTSTRFGGFFLNTGIQYEITTKNKNILRFGAYMNFQQNLSAKQDKVNETIAFDGNGGIVTIDTISAVINQSGKVKLPATYGFGVTHATKNLLVGADIEFSNWDAYRYYGEKDFVQNSYIVRVGAQYYPAKDNTLPSKYWSFVKYRAGMYFGNDYIKLDNNKRPNYAFTAGVGMPLTSLQRISYTGEIVALNAGIEMGVRGNKESQSLRENYMRINIGVSMNARWFVKPKYN
ncbi:MAG: hypothetical protein WEA59_09210 [Ferruginibacter sp.]